MTIQLTKVADTPAPDRQTIRDFLDGNIEAYAMPQPQWGPIGEEVFNRTYARTLDVVTETGEVLGTRTEFWAETVKRVVLGSLSYVDREVWFDDEDVELFDLIYNFRAIPAGRHLWVTGTPVATLSKNCWSASFGVRLASHFTFLAARLLEGGGVGANYSQDILAATQFVTSKINLSFEISETHPDFERVNSVEGAVINNDTFPTVLIVVDDSREGWIDTWGRIVDLACTGHDEIALCIDVNSIRPYGAPLKTFGGTASGPDALVRSIVGMVDVLNTVVDSTFAGRRLTGIEAMSIDHELASAVIAGGSRRSARMALMSWRDPDVFNFINVKSESQSHWTTNISVEIDSGFRRAIENPNSKLHAHAKRVLHAVADGMVRNGEPGLVDTELMSRHEPSPTRITNPCVTGDTWVQTTNGLRQVNDLVGGGRVDLFVNNEVWSTGADGFFKTGRKKIIKVNVDGTELKMTKDHLVSTPDGWRPAGELEVGDVVDLTDSLGNTWGGRGTIDEGYLIGHLIGDGCFAPPNKNGVPGSAILCSWTTKDGAEVVEQHLLDCIDRSGLEHRPDWAGWNSSKSLDRKTIVSSSLRDLAASYGVVHGSKTISDEIMSASSDFIVGLLGGLFDSDGHVEGDSLKGGLSVRFSQSDFEIISRARMLLLSLGIKSVVRFMKPSGMKTMPGGTFFCKDSFRLIVTGEHVERFSKIVGFVNSMKSQRIDEGLRSMKRGFYFKPMVGTVSTIEAGGLEDVYDCQVPGINAFVANGTIVHNCGEVNLHSYDLDGQIAGESCNLGSVDLDAFGTDHEGAQRAFTLMARFLYRATLNPHLDQLASHIEDTNRRIGVGIMGLQGWCAANGARLSEIETNHELRDHLTSFRQTVRKAADALAKELGTPRSVKVTAVAPTGSIAQLRGTQPGIHPIVARYFIRRVRYSTADPGLQALVDSGLTVVDDVYAANTSVVEFTLKDSILDRFDHSLIEQSDEIDVDNFFGIIATVQETFCGGSDGNAVSATAQIDVDASPENLARAIRFRLGTVKGLTVFPKVSRPLAPYEAISEAEYEVALAAGLAQTNGDSNDGECATGACPIR
jgi:ribonucleotide reductase alpha subunit